MSSKRIPILSNLLNSVHSIRNVCILAHVDHGKTTVADALLATNGIVSLRQAGKLRYMDNTEAEQERGITMKSSVIGLSFHKQPNIEQSEGSTFLVNLVDSPGHVDFASEVSTAVRLCDAALIVVDVVESVCPQTRAVLRQAWNERLTLILVLNKIDRLILEMKMTPLQAYEVLCRVIEQVNSVLAEMFTADMVRQRDDAWQFNECSQPSSWKSSEGHGIVYDLDEGLAETDDSNLYFSPDRGNVVFTSAIDTWGFRPLDFLNTWSKRLNVPVERLNSVIWGDFYISKSATSSDGTEQVLFKPDARRNKHRPVFVQLILEPLWKTYQTLVIDGKQSEATSMAKKLGVHLDPRALRNTDSRGVLRALLMEWLPLGQTLLNAIVDICPSPRDAVSADRAVHMFYGDTVSRSDNPMDAAPTGEMAALKIDQTSRTTSDSVYTQSDASMALQACSCSPEAPTIVFVAKIFWTDRLHVVDTRSIPQRTNGPSSENQASNSANTVSGQLATVDQTETALQRPRLPDLNNDVPSTNSSLQADTHIKFVALARIFSGNVYPGQRLFVLGPKFDGNKIPQSLLDADPADFPIGPVRIRTTDDDDGLDASCNHSFELLESSPTASSGATLSRSGSIGSSSGSLHPTYVYLRHVYVAVVVGVYQLLGGQHDLLKVDKSVPAGNIVGLTGPDLVTFLPKSGLLVSRLSLVAGPQAGVDGQTSVPVLPLAGIALWHGAPVLSVAVEPASASNPDDVTRLEHGLRLLDRADPCAEVALAPSGEYLIKAAGEVHLQKCLEDLSKFFVPGVELHVSPFVVPFRETIIAPCEDSSQTLESTASESYKRACQKLELILQQLETYGGDGVLCELKREIADQSTTKQPETASSLSVPSPSLAPDILKSHPSENPSRKRGARDVVPADHDLPQLPIGFFQLPYSKTQTRVLIRVTAHPLPDQLVQWAESRGCRKVPQLIRAFKTKSPNYPARVKQFNEEFSALCSSLPDQQSKSICWSVLSRSFLALGPNQTGPNMLFARMKSNSFPLYTAWGQQVKDDDPGDSTTPFRSTEQGGNALPLMSYAKALLRGFQLATERGPLCAEPMRGVMFIVEEICAEDCYFLEVPRMRCTEQAPTPEEPELGVNETIQKLDECSEIKEETRKHIKPRRRRMTSISWLDDFVDDNEDMFGDEDFAFSSYSEDEEIGNELSPEDVPDSEECVETDEKPNRLGEFVQDLRDIPYWSRREDTAWLHDVTPGLLTSAMNRACLAAFQSCAGQRLMLAMYDLELQARPDVLGRMFAVLRKRHGRVVSEDFREGENIFIISARLPVVESFGLAVELRTRTSGVVSLPQLRPGGWELLDIDPTLKDTTGQESHPMSCDWAGKRSTTRRFDAGSDGQVKKISNAVPGLDEEENPVDEFSAQVLRVRSYIKDVRVRKGLPTNEQIVQFADKQRTLKKNK